MFEETLASLGNLFGGGGGSSIALSAPQAGDVGWGSGPVMGIPGDGSGNTFIDSGTWNPVPQSWWERNGSGITQALGQAGKAAGGLPSGWSGQPMQGGGGGGATGRPGRPVDLNALLQFLAQRRQQLMQSATGGPGQVAQPQTQPRTMGLLGM